MKISYAKFTGENLKAIAQFNRIVKNYLKMKELEKSINPNQKD
jgi:hypothetical protein